ncbi:apolipoprotein D [Tetranychus urticae]|uniref:Lipocalin/cytosolic fatty-acid binding domain-containing protein n=1 Tax=Tetranychus urticae TaxID=32264 RepID=T1L192_TETUR|nr:apolipoprotein D [Tetranychus urticae]
MKQFLSLCVFAISFALVFSTGCEECSKLVKTSLQPGNCPEPNRLPQPFDIKQYLGTWYQIKSTKPYFEDGQRCIKADYKFEATIGIFVTNSTGLDSVNNEVERVQFAKSYDQDNVFTAKAFLGSGYYLTTQYWVVDTDYNNYALVVSCNNLLGLDNSRDVWILSRKPTLDDNIVANLVAELDTVGLHGIVLGDIIQNC